MQCRYIHRISINLELPFYLYMVCIPSHMKSPVCAVFHQGNLIRMGEAKCRVPWCDNTESPPQTNMNFNQTKGTHKHRCKKQNCIRKTWGKYWAFCFAVFVFLVGKNTKTLGGTRHWNLFSFCTPYDTVDGRNPANQLIGGICIVHPIICRVLCIPGG